MVMELKCKQTLPLINLESDSNHDIDQSEQLTIYDEDGYNPDDYKSTSSLITYRDIGIQTESPLLVDKAIQVNLPRSRRKPSITRRSPNYIDCGVHSRGGHVTVNNINSHGLMPNIVYNGNRVSYYESPSSFKTLQSNVDLMEEDDDDDDDDDDEPSIYRYHNQLLKELKVTTTTTNINNKRKNKSPMDGPNSKLTRQQLDADTFADEHDSNDLRLGLISENDDDPLDILDQPLALNGRSIVDTIDSGLEIDDLYIFTHHPTGLSYQIFNNNRSINKEMMEKVFASVIGKQDKFYVCLYPPHAGTCHSSAGKSTKIRVIKNHLTSHLFLYRCRLCGRTYKYYNNLFNHFNKHPQIHCN